MTKRQRKKQAKQYLAAQVLIYPTADGVYERLTWERLKALTRPPQSPSPRPR
jgi:hypothetical protein